MAVDKNSKVKKDRNKTKKQKSIKAKVTDMMGSKRRLTRFGKEQKKGMRGSAANYITRGRALKKLQLNLKDFRRLCILKGIYPRDPKKKSDGPNQTYYYIKDVMHLAHEPLLQHFREFKIFMKKMTRAVGRRNISDAERREKHAPTYELVHIIKERYPQFQDAVGDLDDALCLVHLFSMMPASDSVPASRTDNCMKLVREWQNYLIMSRTLTKVFVSIKGIYYQAKILGQDVTWLVPHQFTPEMDESIDFSIMSTFLEFYEALLKFVNYKLYTDMGVSYPPKIDLKLDAAGACLRAMNIQRVNDSDTAVQHEVSPEIQAQQNLTKNRVDTLPTASLVLATDETPAESVAVSLVEPLEEAFASDKLAQQIYSEHSKKEQENNLFAGFRFFLSREVPQSCLEVVIRSFGGQVGWDGKGSPYSDISDLVTHHIMDRPTTGHRYFNREYIQPQWIFDCCNAAMLLPVERYAPGCALPPHLSPFVDDQKEGYVPEYRQKIDQLKSARDILQHDKDEERSSGIPYANGTENEESSSDESTNSNGKRVLSLEPTVTSKKARQQKDDQEMKELAKTMMSKKAKRLYDRMQYGLNKKSTKALTLQAKADALKTKND